MASSWFSMARWQGLPHNQSNRSTRFLDFWLVQAYGILSHLSVPSQWMFIWAFFTILMIFQRERWIFSWKSIETFTNWKLKLSCICTVYFYLLFKPAFMKAFMLNWGLSYYSGIFHPYGNFTIEGDGLRILTYARHSWPFSRENFLSCQTYRDTGLCWW